MKAKIKATGEIITLVNRTRANEQGVLGVFYWVDEQGTEYPASDLDFLPEKETAVLEGWIARDRLNNALFLHDEKPCRAFSGYQTDGKEDEWRSETCPPYPIDKDSFPSVTWQSGPKRVRIIIEEI